MEKKLKYELKPCNFQITLPTPEYNKMVEYIKKLENAVGIHCGNCVGCEAYDESVINGLEKGCDSWVWNGGSK